jgi:hypothetical protein
VSDASQELPHRRDLLPLEEGFLLAAEGLLGPLAPGKVLGLDDEVERGAVRAAEERDRPEHPDHLAVLPAVARLARVGVELPGEHPAVVVGVEGPLVGMRDLSVGPSEELRLRVAQEVAQGAVHPDVAALEVLDRDPDGRVLEGPAEALLARLERRARLLPGERDGEETRHRLDEGDVVARERPRRSAVGAQDAIGAHPVLDHHADAAPDPMVEEERRRGETGLAGQVVDDDRAALEEREARLRAWSGVDRLVADRAFPPADARPQPEGLAVRAQLEDHRVLHVEGPRHQAAGLLHQLEAPRPGQRPLPQVGDGRLLARPRLQLAPVARVGFPRLPVLSRPVDGRAYRRGQPHEVVGPLDHVVVEARPERFGGDLLAARAREHDHGAVGPALAHPAQHREPVGPPELVVRDDHVVLVRVEGPCELLRPADLLDPELAELPPELPRDQGAVVRVVVHEEDAEGRVHARGPEQDSCPTGFRAQLSDVTVVPALSARSASTPAAPALAQPCHLWQSPPKPSATRRSPAP